MTKLGMRFCVILAWTTNRSAHIEKHHVYAEFMEQGHLIQMSEIIMKSDQ